MNGRKRAGFPEWEKVNEWLKKEVLAGYPKAKCEKEPVLKNPEIPILKEYESPASDEFWKKFPKRELPEKVETRVNIMALRKRVWKAKDKMSKTELNRAKKVLRSLQTGAEACQMSALPPVTAQNNKNVYEHGRFLTDTIGTWIKKGFVAGPFSTPPVPGFRSNPLGVVVKNGKTRPILNMSGPVGASFNDNVDERKMERLHMGTAKEFSYLLKDAGFGARFSKFDIQDAYKLVPAKKEDFRLQGFKWLGKYFVETRLSFGGKPSPPNFDALGKTKDLLVCIESNTPRFAVPRALDDTPVVASEETKIVEKFTHHMKLLCTELNIPLAENCPKAEKAFELVQRGTVLGVGFDSRDMTWYLSEEKADKVTTRCLDAMKAPHMDLKQTQKLMGSVNDLAQMSPILKAHKRTGNQFLGSFEGNTQAIKPVPARMREDLAVIAKVSECAKRGLPIASKPGKPGLAALRFYTDAAGASFSTQNGEKRFHDNSGKGVACIGGSCKEDIWAWSRLSWPANLITGMKDEKGSYYGCKSTMLESVGILIPLIAFPDMVKGRQLVFKVDNIAVMWGWRNGYVKNDGSATEVLKAARYLAGYLGADIYIEHVDRMSEELACMADELSRRAQCKSAEDNAALSEGAFRPVTGFLLEWLRDPGGKKDLTLELLSEIQRGPMMSLQKI